ncbi:MAG: DinB family protein [Bacteroidota bacterium]
MLQSKDEILQAAKAMFIRVEDWLKTHPDEKYNQGPEGKWHTAQHIDHLTVVNKQIKTGLSLPKLALRAQFGKPNRPGRTYDQIVQRYLEKLDNLDETFTNPTEGKTAEASEKGARIEAYMSSGELVLKKLSKWKEDDLDKYLLPHPLLGKMTIREMMLWFVYHNEHHLKNLQENY